MDFTKYVEWFKNINWDIVQYAGMGLIGLAIVLTWLKLFWIALVILIAVGILDIGLVVVNKETISQRIHKWFPQWADTIVMVAFVAFTWWIWGVAGFLPVLMGVILGHLFWHED